MNRYSQIAMRVASRPKVRTNMINRRIIALSWHYEIRSPLDEKALKDYMDICREQTVKEARELGEELRVSAPNTDASYVTGMSKDMLKVTVDVDYRQKPGDELTWDDVAEVLKMGGWL